MASLNQQEDFIIILITIYCFVDDFLKGVIVSIEYALERPNRNHPPMKRRNLGLAELVSLALFRFFTGHDNWKDFYRHITTYHGKDFPLLPTYQNFVKAMNAISFFALMLLQAFMNFFREITGEEGLKFVDSTALRACNIKREFSHKVCKRIAKKSKSTMGWFYGFKLHIICNELLQILSFAITAGNVDDRKGLEMMWNHIFGMIIADAGYIGKEWQEKARSLGKHLFTAVKANMRKIMTSVQHELLKLRQGVETVLSVLKLRLGMETSLPRSELGMFAHYVWCLAAYQLKKYLEFVLPKPLPA